jgi:hypothetical protein
MLSAGLVSERSFRVAAAMSMTNFTRRAPLTTAARGPSLTIVSNVFLKIEVAVSFTYAALGRKLPGVLLGGWAMSASS